MEKQSVPKVLVVGGSGFLGRAVQRHVIDEKLVDDFCFGYHSHPENVCSVLQSLRMNLLENTYSVKDYDTVIYLAGNSDQAYAESHPSVDLDLNAKAFVNFASKFNCSLILFSSQAVYDNLRGKIYENEDHVASKPYAISKQATESYAKHFLRVGRLEKLWIFRSRLVFGHGEKERRLIPRCAKSARGEGNLTVFGGGQSVLSPLPSWFVAEVLVRAVETIRKKRRGFLEVTNINYPEKITTLDVVKFLHGIKPFRYSIVEHGEAFPVKCWGDTDKLSDYLKEWNMSFPDVWIELGKYFSELVS